MFQLPLFQMAVIGWIMVTFPVSLIGGWSSHGSPPSIAVVVMTAVGVLDGA